MADSATDQWLARRARWKLWGPPLCAAAAALGAAALLGYHPVAALFNLVQNLLLAVAGRSEVTLIAGQPVLQRLIDWIAAPVVWFALTLGIVSFGPVRRAIDRIFPDPPPFVLSDLEGQRRRSMILIAHAPTAFVGRQQELDSLGVMLDRAVMPGPFRWRAVLGPSGIGKTRLAIEWLAAAQADGWDVGIVDPEDHARLAGWRPRRPTALVIDEARSRWDKQLAGAMLALGARATAGAPVRLLVLDQIVPYVKLPDATEQHRLDETQIVPPLVVSRMSEADIRALAVSQSSAAADHIVEGSAGRPRIAIILANIPDATSYSDALRRWAELLIPELTDDSATPPAGLSVPLIFSALIGPVLTERIRAHLGEFDPGPLLRFFDGVRRDDLERELPQLVPDDLAQEMALRLLPKLDVPRRAEIVQALIEQAPAVMEASLGAIWRDRPDLDRASDVSVPAAMLRELQARFDDAHPERVEAIVDQTGSLVDDTAEANTLDKADLSLALLAAIALTRPFDPAIRRQEARGAVNAITHFGGALQWGELERWGKRLISIAEDVRFAADPAIRVCEAIGAVNALSNYGRAQRWDDFQRWSDRLIALVEDTRFAADPAIRLQETRAAANAISHYGNAQQWEAVERWGNRLIAVAEDSRFAADSPIRLREAMAAAHAIALYGDARQWESLERWANRLIALAEDHRFAADPEMRLYDAMGAYNAVTSYGEAHQWDDLERWGSRLIALAGQERFASDPAIRLHEATGALNALGRYGEVERWNEVERWGSRLIALAEDERFTAHPAIRLEEAKGAANAIAQYGGAQRWDDLERWGYRLLILADDRRFAADPAIRYTEATGAKNAIARYGRVQSWDDLERWGQRLIVLAEDERFAADPAIWREIASGAVNAIISYGEAGLHGSGRDFSWKRQLAFASQAFPLHTEIQDLARRYDLTWSQQQRRNFVPYGQVASRP